MFRVAAQGGQGQIHTLLCAMLVDNAFKETALKGIYMFSIQGKHTTANIMIDQLDQETTRLISTMVNHPAFTEDIAIMPDAHAGKGSCIGFTMPLSSHVVPNVIGVDINCGMLSLDFGGINYDPEEADKIIREKVPFGASVHERPIFNMEDFPWDTLYKRCAMIRWHLQHSGLFGDVQDIPIPDFGPKWFEDKCCQILCFPKRALASIGTLGGGNHFIEASKSANTGSLWITIHTGSRNLGKCICEFWQNRAAHTLQAHRQNAFEKGVEQIKNNTQDKAKIPEKIKALKKETGDTKGVSIKGMEWLQNPEDVLGYLFDMSFAQMYADLNREMIARQICKALQVQAQDRIETRHNFIDFDSSRFMIRKGAVRANLGERMIVPFNMRDGILVCQGKSNKEWNFSAPHGAGRIKSRSKAKETNSLSDYEGQMRSKGIYSTSVCQATLDEAPDSYKDPKIIEEAIHPTAEIVDRLIPVHNMKAKK